MEDFEILSEVSHSEPYSDRSVTIRKVRCPDCGKIFTQKATGGFVQGFFTPMDCPNCSHPLHHLKNLSSKQKVIDDE